MPICEICARVFVLNYWQVLPQKIGSLGERCSLSQGSVSCLFLGREGGAWFTVLRSVPICTSTARSADVDAAVEAPTIVNRKQRIS